MSCTRRTPAAGGADLLGANLGRRTALGSTLGCSVGTGGTPRGPEEGDEVESLSLDLRTPLTREQARFGPDDNGRVYKASGDAISVTLPLPGGRVLTTEVLEVGILRDPRSTTRRPWSAVGARPPPGDRHGYMLPDPPTSPGLVRRR